MGKLKKVVILVLFLFLLIQSNLFKGQSIIAPLAMDYKEVILISKAAKSYIRDSSITIILNPIAPLHPYVEGVTHQINPKLYILEVNNNIKNKIQRKWVWLHELGHVIDIYNGFLSQFPPKWMGKKLNYDLPWDIRPWEISADEWAFELWATFVDEPPPYIIFRLKK